MAKSTTVAVEDIHCAGCERTISTALSGVAGVLSVNPSAARNDVRVSFDEASVGEAELRAKLAEIGFEPVG